MFDIVRTTSRSLGFNIDLSFLYNMAWEIFLLRNVDHFTHAPTPNLYTSSPWREENIQMPSLCFYSSLSPYV